MKSKSWKNIEEGRQPTVEQQQNSALQKQIEENRKILLPIIETIIFCGRQGIALRAHRDHGDINNHDIPSQNEGNFRALLRFRIT